MDSCSIEDQYLRDNKLFGQMAGVWPKQEKFMKYTARIVTFFIVMLSNVAQSDTIVRIKNTVVLKLASAVQGCVWTLSRVSQVVVFYNFDVLTDQLPFLVLGTGIFVKQYNYILNEAKLNQLLDGIVTDWITKRPDEELNILQMYYRRAAYFSSFYKATIICCMLTFILLPTIPPIMDIIAPLNYTRPRILVYPSYYFVDEHQYYYPILAHMIISAFILVFVFIACDLNLVHIVQHACALFAISGYRFKHATDDEVIYETKDGRGIVDENYAKVTRSIDAHKRAIEYVELVEACHVHCFFFTLGLVMLVLTITLLKLTTMERSTAYFTYCGFVVAQLIHLFFLTIMGQFVIDSNEEFFQTICEARWYNGSIKTQSLYVLVLRKCLNSPKLTGGGFVALNLDSFLKVVKASFSYYTVLKSA